MLVRRLTGLDTNILATAVKRPWSLIYVQTLWEMYPPSLHRAVRVAW